MEVGQDVKQIPCPGVEEKSVDDIPNSLDRPISPKQAPSKLGILQRALNFLANNPPIVATVMAIFVALTPARKLLYSPGAPLSFVASSISVMGKAGPAITSTIAGGSFGLQVHSLLQPDRPKGDILGLRALGVSQWALLALVLCRTVLVPLMNLAMVLLLFNALPEDPWSRLLLFFQPAGVTANMVTVLAHSMDSPRATQLVAIASIPQMLFYIPMSTGLISIGKLWCEN